MKDGIDWAEVGSGGRFEKIVSILLSTLHPDSERIDGAGGDGGRDHQLRVGGQLHLWQSKYFLRRLSESTTRKRQISESLAAAAALQPHSWTLVTPMVPNKEERAWFDELKGDYSFPLVWRGGDWLDARLKDHPAIVRHFMSANDEYVALLRELEQEQEAIVDGLPAARPRIEQLAAKINNSNPFYKIDFTVRDGQISSCSLRPKYRGAEKDSPITIKFDLVAGPADVELVKSLRSALDWGETAVLPASHVRNVVITGPPGFSEAHDQANVTIGPAPAEPVDLSLRLVIQGPEGGHLVALPARLITRIAGARGVTLHGRDMAGVVDARLRLDRAESRFSLSLTCTWARPLLPGAALPILRFLRHAGPPNTLSFEIGKALNTTPVTMPEGIAVPEESVQFVEDLDRLQVAAGEPFPVPREWTLDDQHEVRRAIRLLDGKRAEMGRGPVRLSMTNPQRFLEAFDHSHMPPVTIIPSEPYIAHVAGHDLDLGPCTYHLPKAQLEPSSAEPTADGTCQFQLRPGPDCAIEVALGTQAVEDC